MARPTRRTRRLLFGQFVSRGGVCRDARIRASVTNGVPSASLSSLADARCSSLGYTASQLANLLVSEVVDGEARLLQLVTDVHGG